MFLISLPYHLGEAPQALKFAGTAVPVMLRHILAHFPCRGERSRPGAGVQVGAGPASPAALSTQASRLVQPGLQALCSHLQIYYFKSELPSCGGCGGHCLSPK